MNSVFDKKILTQFREKILLYFVHSKVLLLFTEQAYTQSPFSFMICIFFHF